MQSYSIVPIGIVRNDFDETNVPEDWSNVISEIRLNARYKKGLYRLRQFKNIMVVFWFHKAKRTKMQVHPRGDKSRPIRGVFATRSPHRPNKLGVSEVELLAVKSSTIKVRGLDAFNGTPVLDIKSTDKCK